MSRSESTNTGVWKRSARSKAANFYRYLDVDGDHIAARSLPGTHPKGAYFTRGSGHNKLGGYTEDASEYMEVVDRIAKKIDSAAEKVPAPIVESHGQRYGLITIGSCDGAVREAMEELTERGVAVDYLRVRGFPFAAAVRQFIDAHELCFIVEANRDAQLMTLLRIELQLGPEKLRSVRYYGGMPMSSHHIVNGVVAALEPAKPTRVAVVEAKS